MSKVEYVQVFFYYRGKKKGPILQATTPGEESLLHSPLGMEVKESREAKLQYLVGFKDVLDSASYFSLEQSHRHHQRTKPLCSLPFTGSGPPRQGPTDNTQTSTTQKGENSKKQIQTPEKILINPSSKAILTPNIVENWSGTTSHWFFATEINIPEFLFKKKDYKGVIDY